jgi:Na+-driven multidrug efflux pump
MDKQRIVKLKKIFKIGFFISLSLFLVILIIFISSNSFYKASAGPDEARHADYTSLVGVITAVTSLLSAIFTGIGTLITAIVALRQDKRDAMTAQTKAKV